MKFYVAITDRNWFEHLSVRSLEEVNFWRPSGMANFNAIAPGELFLFKLHSPDNFIVGGGVYSTHYALPFELAWDTFGEANGVRSLAELKRRLHGYARGKAPGQIGCTILHSTFWWPRDLWIPVQPHLFSRNIVSGKSYQVRSPEGQWIWERVLHRLPVANLDSEGHVADAIPGGTVPTICQRRLGQGAFRVAVTRAYTGRCAISGEKTLPVLQASHIRPFSEQGPNEVRNGLLLRSDLHILFDRGFITVDADSLRIKVSPQIRQRFENGRDYYRYLGQPLVQVPRSGNERPHSAFLEYHNREVYVA